MKGKNIDLTNDQYTQLQDLIQFAYRSNYYHDNNTILIDELYEAVENAKVTYLSNKMIQIDLSPEQYNNVMTILREAHERSKDSILTCSLQTTQIDNLLEAFE